MSGLGTCVLTGVMPAIMGMGQDTRDYGFTEIKIHGNDSRGVVKYSSAITQ